MFYSGAVPDSGAVEASRGGAGEAEGLGGGGGGMSRSGGLEEVLSRGLRDASLPSWVLAVSDVPNLLIYY